MSDFDHLEKFVRAPVRQFRPPTPVVPRERVAPKLLAPPPPPLVPVPTSAPDAPAQSESMRRWKERRRTRWPLLAQLATDRPAATLNELRMAAGFKDHATVRHALVAMGLWDPHARAAAQQEKRERAALRDARMQAEARARRWQERADRIAAKEQEVAEKTAAKAKQGREQDLHLERISSGRKMARLRAVAVKEALRKGLSRKQVAERFGLSAGYVKEIHLGYKMRDVP